MQKIMGEITKIFLGVKAVDFRACVWKRSDHNILGTDLKKRVKSMGATFLTKLKNHRKIVKKPAIFFKVLLTYIGNKL